MTELVPLDLPGAVTTGTKASSKAARRAYDPWADHLHGGILPLGYAPLPDEFTVSEILLSLQAPWVTPSYPQVPAPGFYGRTCFIVDTDGSYWKEMDWLATAADEEDGWPRQLKPLGYVAVWPGAQADVHVPFIARRPSLVGPVTLKKSLGSRILVMPETNDIDISPFVIGSFAVFGAPYIPMEQGYFPLAPGVAHAMVLNKSFDGSRPPCYRTVIPNTLSGGRVEVHFTAGQHAMNIAHASVGLQAAPGSPHMAGPPVPLTFAGPSSLAASEHVWASAALPVDGRPIVVDMDLTGGQGWSFKNRAAPESGIVTYWSNTASYANASMSTPGGAPQLGRVHGFDCLKVMP